MNTPQENVIIPLDLAAKELIQRDEPHGEIGGNVLKSKRFCGGF
jgi:hypothetical protein